jgi:hypothetical protein
MLFLIVRVTMLIGCSKENNVFVRKLVGISNYNFNYGFVKNSICRTRKPFRERTISISGK